jgi:hypothetical protein
MVQRLLHREHGSVNTRAVAAWLSQQDTTVVSLRHACDGTSQTARHPGWAAAGPVRHSGHMTREIPAPLRAAAGLAAVAVEEARRLPSRLASLPVVAVSTALQASMRVQQRYADLVGRGDQVLAGLREPDEQPPWARFDEDEASPNGRAAAYRPESGSWTFADEEIGPLADDADEYDEYMAETATGEPPEPAGATPPDASGTGQDSESRADPPVHPGGSKAQQSMHPARPAGRRSSAARSTAAGSTAAKSAVTKSIGAKSAGAKTTGTRAGGRKAATAGTARPAEPGPAPLPNYDRLTLAQVRARLTRLSADDLAALLEHERTHAGRAPYLTMLENRLNKTHQR